MFKILALLLIASTALADNATYIKGPALIESSSTTATAAGTTTLTVSSNTNQEFTGTTTQNVVLPNATTLANGRRFKIWNRSTGVLTLKNNGASTLTTIAAGTDLDVILISNSTSNGSWSYKTQTSAQATAALDAFAGDSGAGAVKGLVPAASAGDATKYLRGDATWTTVTGGGGGTGINYLQNYNADFQNSTNNWTASGGTFTSTGAAANIIPPNTAAGSWDSSSASQTLTSTAVTITGGDGASGQNVTGGCYLKCASGSCTHTIQLYDGTNILNSATVTSSTSSFIPTYVTAPAPTSGSLYLRMVSVASNEPTVYVSNCFLGRADSFNTVQVSQAKLVGTAVVTGCAAGWDTTSTSFASLSTQSSCSYSVTGDALAPATNLAGFKFASLPPGEYRLEYEGAVRVDVANSLAYFQFSDGTNTARETSVINSAGSALFVPGISQSISYSTAQSNVTFQVKAKVDSGATGTVYGTTARPGVFKLWFFPTQSQTAYRADTTPASWSGYHGSNCGWNNSSGSFSDPATDATCSLTERQNRNFGTVAGYTSGGNQLPGIVLTPPMAGRYFVCANATIGNSSTGYSDAELYDGTNTIAQNSAYITSNQSVVMMPLCGIWNVATVQSYTLRIRTRIAGGTAALGGSNASAVEWSVIQLDAPAAAPLLVGSVTSNTTGLERVERASVNASCGSSPCTITAQSGAWLSSVTRASSGDYTANIVAGIFSAAPSCTVSGIHSAGGFGCFLKSAPTTSAVNIICSQVNNAGGVSDLAFNLNCMGPR